MKITAKPEHITICCSFKLPQNERPQNFKQTNGESQRENVNTMQEILFPVSFKFVSSKHVPFCLCYQTVKEQRANMLCLLSRDLSDPVSHVSLSLYWCLIGALHAGHVAIGHKMCCVFYPWLHLKLSASW